MRSPEPPRRRCAASPGRLRGTFDALESRRPTSFRDEDPRRPPTFDGENPRRPPTFDGDNPRRPPTFDDGHSRRAPTYDRGDSRPRPIFGGALPHRRSPAYEEAAPRRPPMSERLGGPPLALRGAPPGPERYGRVAPHRDISPPIPGECEFAAAGEMEEAPPPPDWRRYADAGSFDDLQPPSEKRRSKSRSPPRHKRRDEAPLVAVIGAAGKHFGMTQLQSEAAKAALLAELDKVLLEPKRGGALTFKSLVYESGALKVHCEDVRTLEWLRKTVESLPPPWDKSTRLKLQPPPRRLLKLSTRLWLPNETAPVDVVKKRLAAQNCDWVDIRAWSLLHHSTEPAGMMLTLGVPADDVPKLQKRKFKIHHGFARVTLMCKLSDVKAVVDDSNKR